MFSITRELLKDIYWSKDKTMNNVNGARSEARKIVNELEKGLINPSQLPNIPLNKKKKEQLLNRLKKRDKPLLATSDAHGPG